MAHQVEITGITGGTGPFNIEVCDLTNTYCTNITSSIFVPPTLTFIVPSPFDSTTPILVKVIDSNGCEYFNIVKCVTTPTPTPTPTLTPTLTLTPTSSNCLCLVFENPTIETLFYQYTDCIGRIVNSKINPGMVLYVCGTNPSGSEGLIYFYNGYCTKGECPPLPSPTPAPMMCFDVVTECVDCNSWQCSIPFTGYYNGKPYYILLGPDCSTPLSVNSGDITFVVWNSTLSRWEVVSALSIGSIGSGIICLTNNNPSNYPETSGIYSWVSINLIDIFSSIQGTCPTPTPTPTPICDCLLISAATETCGTYTMTLNQSSIIDGKVSFTGVEPPTLACTSGGNNWVIQYNSGSTQWEAYYNTVISNTLASTSDFPNGTWVNINESHVLYISSCSVCPTPSS